MGLEMEKGNYVFTDAQNHMCCTLPGKWRVKECGTKELPTMTEEEIRKAVVHPSCGKRLSDIVREKEAHTVCVLISDATRAVPTAKLAGYVMEELTEAGIALSDVTFFVAIGVHRPATEEEFREMLGDLYGKVKIENHTPFDEDNLIMLGTTTRGTPVKVNKRAYACDLHIQIGKVEPHEFAGFSGGRKSVLPGISSEETIITNHRPEMILDPRSAIGTLEGNPVHEDMTESAEMFGIDFAVNCIINGELKLSAVYAGELKKSHETAVDFVRERLGVRIEKADVIVTAPGFPLDIDFYQSVKALIALTEVLDESTSVVLRCGCREGVNSPDMLRAFRAGDDLETVVKYAAEHYKIQMDHVLLLAKILRKKVKIYVVCDHVPDEEIRDMFMIPCAGLQEAVERAAAESGKERPEILFYPRPQTGLPVLEKRQPQ